MGIKKDASVDADADEKAAGLSGLFRHPVEVVEAQAIAAENHEASVFHEKAASRTDFEATQGEFWVGKVFTIAVDGMVGGMGYYVLILTSEVDAVRQRGAGEEAETEVVAQVEVVVQQQGQIHNELPVLGLELVVVAIGGVHTDL